MLCGALVLGAEGNQESLLCHSVGVSPDPECSQLSDAEQSCLAGILEHARSVGANPDDPGSIGAYFDSALNAVEAGTEDSKIANSVVNAAAQLGEIRFDT